MISKPCPERPGLMEMARRAAEEFKSWSPDKQRQALRIQRKSWVVGEMMLEHPDMTRERAEAIYDEVV